MDSILTSIKKLLGIAEEYEHFDADLIMHINSVFMVLAQIGVGPAGGFMISDDSAIWEDFVSDPQNVAAVKSYMHMKVKLLFDPPASSTVMESMNRLINELEWRLSIIADTDFSGSNEVPGGSGSDHTGEPADSVLLTDRVTAKEHEIYVASGELMLSDEIEEEDDASDEHEGILLVDRDTAVVHELYVAESELYIAESEDNNA